MLEFRCGFVLTTDRYMNVSNGYADGYLGIEVDDALDRADPKRAMSHAP